MSRKTLALVAVALLVAVAGCAGAGGGSSDGDSGPKEVEKETNAPDLSTYEVKHDGVTYICFEKESVDGAGEWRAGKYGMDCTPKPVHEQAKNMTTSEGDY